MLLKKGSCLNIVYSGCESEIKIKRSLISGAISLAPQLRWNYKATVYERSSPSCISLVFNVNRVFCCFCENSVIMLCQELYKSACNSAIEFHIAGFL